MRSTEIVNTSRSRKNDSGTAVRLNRLSAIQRYEPGDLTVRVQAGVKVADLLRILGEHRQILPLDGLPPESTVGGVLASAAHAPLATGYGLVRDFCIGIEFVTAQGEIAHAGGTVVKNVAGYDLMKLIIGSRGTLGIITSATFKCFPTPQRTATLKLEFASAADAVDYALRVRRSVLTPIRLELWGSGEEWRVLVTAIGSDAVIARYRNELGDATLYEGPDEEALWAKFGESAASKCADLWFPVGSASSVVGCVRGASKIRGRIGLGNLVCEFEDEALVPSHPNAFIEWRNPRKPMELTPLMMRVKESLDPAGKLNPGAIAG